MRPAYTLILCLILLAATAVSVFAMPVASVKYTLTRAENTQGTKSILVVPYAFSAYSTGFSYGIGALATGYGQEQLQFGGTVLGSTDEAAIVVLGLWDLRFPWWDRLYLTVVGLRSWYPRQRAYTFPYYPAGSTRPGSNASDPSQYIESGGNDDWFETTLEYVLPIGSGRNDSLMRYDLRDGLLTSPPTGGNGWNPLESGVSILMLHQYNHYQDYQVPVIGTVSGTIHPWSLGLLYDNTDFPANPSTGSKQFLAISRSFPWHDSDLGYTFWEFETSHYWDLGASECARQRIIALNLWTGDAPTWQEQLGSDGNIRISGRPPFLDGARLGGYYRMRGYPNNRFHGRSVIYTTAEYRHTLRWNPVETVSWLKFLQADWFQLVGFAEGGRVADRPWPQDLGKDWKIDGGIGLRAMMAGSVLRLDFGVSQEALNIWAMFGHPF